MCLAILNDDIRVGLDHHGGGALVELHGGVLQLPEHHGLGARQQDGDHPGDKNHRPGKRYKVLHMKTIMKNIST